MLRISLFLQLLRVFNYLEMVVVLPLKNILKFAKFVYKIIYDERKSKIDMKILKLLTIGLNLFSIVGQGVGKTAKVAGKGIENSSYSLRRGVEVVTNFTESVGKYTAETGAFINEKCEKINAWTSRKLALEARKEEYRELSSKFNFESSDIEEGDWVLITPMHKFSIKA